MTASGPLASLLAVLQQPGERPRAATAWANIDMYRSGDEFARRKIAEAILLAFVISVPLILAVGFLQFFLLPALNWIFAFSILMLAWIVGTVVSAIRHR